MQTFDAIISYQKSTPNLENIDPPYGSSNILTDKVRYKKICKTKKIS